MKTLTIEIRVREETVVEMEVLDVYRMGDIKRLIKEGRYRTVSHTVYPSRAYEVIKEEVK